MEAVGGGASALAFIGIALKSTEAIYKTISGIKDAPDKVERLLSAVDDLRSILKQLSGLFAPPVAAQAFNDFDAAIQKCNEDLASLAKKLSLLHKIAGDGKWKSTWKRIKAVLKKEDIQEMWTTVHHHVTVLGVYVGVLQSFSMTRQTQSIFALEQAFQTNTNHVRSNTQTLEAQASLISSFDGRFRLLESHSSAAQQTAEQALGVLGQKIDAMPSLSENQFEVIKSMLNQLSIQQIERTVVEQCSTSSQSSSATPGSYQDSDSNTHSSSSASSTSSSSMAAHSFDILSSITRLCGLVNAKEKTVGSSEAVEIIEDLEVLLNTIQDAPASVAGEKRKRDDETAVEKSDIKRAKGILTSAYHVKVNNEKRILRARDPTRSVDKRTSKAVTTEDGTLLLRTRTRSENDASMDEKILGFAANLTFMSSRPEIRMKISACFYQRMLSEGSYLIIPPMLSVHVIVPDDSDIFKLIKNDDLRGVVELLEQGRASLRDCDTKGRSLLSYASYAKSADICRFLVERGADVDALEVLISDAYGEDWETLV
ncbi:hypothetical protein SLS55_009063 [Diplodia seriata]|uniref:Azaphilone pigments biosynthesis cluster protein L N-terminal domain-containing protein n=1 Tax=Diplodia seriata TaxID=420778 RepID=A0ABR3C7Q9_9PEZI